MNNEILSPELEGLLAVLVSNTVDYQRNLDKFLVEKCFENSAYRNYDDFYEAVATLEGKRYVSFEEDESSRITRIKVLGPAFTYSIDKGKAKKIRKLEHIRWLVPTILSIVALVLSVVALIRA